MQHNLHIGQKVTVKGSGSSGGRIYYGYEGQELIVHQQANIPHHHNGKMIPTYYSDTWIFFCELDVDYSNGSMDITPIVTGLRDLQMQMESQLYQINQNTSRIGFSSKYDFDLLSTNEKVTKDDYLVIIDNRKTIECNREIFIEMGFRNTAVNCKLPNGTIVKAIRVATVKATKQSITQVESVDGIQSLIETSAVRSANLLEQNWIIRQIKGSNKDEKSKIIKRLVVYSGVNKC